jgi:hypothetical protein
MSEHRWTLEEYDALHALVGLGAEWLNSERRRETRAEIEAGVGPGELDDATPRA